MELPEIRNIAKNSNDILIPSGKGMKVFLDLPHEFGLENSYVLNTTLEIPGVEIIAGIIHQSRDNRPYVLINNHSLTDVKIGKDVLIGLIDDYDDWADRYDSINTLEELEESAKNSKISDTLKD